MTTLQAVPVLRIFDEAVARGFYVDWLGFTVEWEHRFAPDMPLYMAISLGGMTLHLTGHHGDACPGSTVYIRATGLDALHARLAARPHPGARPGIAAMPWGERQMQLTDPFGNKLRFAERNTE